MSQYYDDAQKSVYLVTMIDGNVVGGCGIAAFTGDDHICELRKQFLLPASRGLGLGKKLTQQCLLYTKKQGYQRCI